VSYLEIPGAQLYYEVEEGRGPPLTLIHAGVAHLRMWDEQVAAFAPRHRVIRYDTRGFGRTRNEDVAYSNRDDLRRLLDHLGVERTYLLGTSRGGMIAIDFTLEAPDRVGALILVASGLGGHEEPESDIDWDELERLEEARDWARLVERETEIWVDGPGQPPGRVDPAVRRQMIEWNLENYRGDHPAGQPQRLEPAAAGRLHEIGVPTLVCWGDLDEPGVPSAGERLASEIRGARRHVFPGVAHMVSLERPAELSRLVLDFLESVEAGQASATNV
jgi:3-oxoadipate enol-lactonase